ncbi:helix-turn-helix transcriptional regulator [Tateyamaria sp.]|uniref:helix-turn-helix transcriptional regulator n=1 Tax=Tateyamaria sp. TaxID=1929288 RepID=UPI00329D6899
MKTIKGVDPLLRKPAVLEATGLSSATLHRILRTREFPAPVRITSRTLGWKASEIQAWIDSRPTAAA